MLQKRRSRWWAFLGAGPYLVQVPYVTYPGQELTCKYCGEKGHFQTKCNKRLNDFPQLEKQSNDCVITQNKPHSDKTEFELGKEKPVNLSKKRKLAKTDSNVDLTNL